MSVTFATACWEHDWRQVLLHPNYLKKYQIAHHNYPFDEKLLVINNVKNLSLVLEAANQRIEEGVLDRVVLSQEAILSRFQMTKEDFCKDSIWRKGNNPKVPGEAFYYSALGPLTAICSASCDYLLYQCGDVFLPKPVGNWIKKVIPLMRANPLCKLATIRPQPDLFLPGEEFYCTPLRFSDHLFFAKCSDLYAPIYNEPREDVTNYPWGDTFEMRTFSAMKNRGWQEIIYTAGEYEHKTVDEEERTASWL